MLLWSNVSEDNLAAFSYLPEYPTYPQVVSWFSTRRRMYLTGFVQEFVKNRSVSHEGFVFLANGLMIGYLVGVYPFCPCGGPLRGSGFQPGFLGLPCTFHRTVLMY